MSTELQTLPGVPTDIEVTAETADEMAQCQSALILWCENKVASMKKDAAELTAAYEHALKQKWKSGTLKRHSELAVKRVSFYERMLSALQHGYQIVPPFPVTVFAVRTTRGKPLRMLTQSWSSTHEQVAVGLPTGEGDYKNPFPVVHQRMIQASAPGKCEVSNYWAEAWDDFEFPISMAKPQIMEATTRAMALKIFDDFAIVPSEIKRDPMILARLKDPRMATWSSAQRWVYFIIAWHLDTRTL